VSLACDQFGISRRTYYYWLKKLKEGDLNPESLRPISRAPKRRPGTIKGRLKEEILKLRKEYLYGPDRIAWYMKEYGYSVSGYGVYRVLSRENMPFRKKRSKKPNLHKKRYVLTAPGQGIQLDIKYVPFLVEGKKAYEFNAIDDCSRWRFAYLYSNLGIDSAMDFANRLAKAAPFTIKSIQTDNDISFTDRFLAKSLDYNVPHPFPELLDALKILHKLIPPGAKELNGKVERSHKTDMEEFYWKIPKNTSFDDLQLQLSRWIYAYNNHRPHSELKMKTPAQRLQDFGLLANTVRSIVEYVEDKKNNAQPMAGIFADKLKLLEKNNSYFINMLPKSKRKRKSLLQRALEFMEVPNLLHTQCNMSQNFTSKTFVANLNICNIK
jgi:transposase InsO family protein